MSVEANKELVRRLAEVINQGNLFVLDQVAAPDFVLHHSSGRDFSKEDYAKNALALRNAFPDVYMELEDLIAEDDKVVCLYTITGTHKGEYEGIPPTGNKISIQGINFFRIADRKIAEIWPQLNSLDMMQQLGVIPPMGKKVID